MTPGSLVSAKSVVRCPSLVRLLVIVGVAMVLVSCTGKPAADASGLEIYDQLCARCHGSDLEGQIGPALGPGSLAADEDDEFIRATILNGRGRMPSFDRTLSDEQIERVIAYLRAEQQ